MHQTGILLSLLYQLSHEMAETTGSRIGAFVHIFCLRPIKARVALSYHYDTRCVLRSGDGKGSLHPSSIGTVAFQVFSVRSITLHVITDAFIFALFLVRDQIVVAARLVNADKHDAAVGKASVLHKFLAQLALVL
jgi:hypothetical protein